MSHRKDLLRELQQRQAEMPGGGKRYWRSLEELAQTDAFQELVKLEFPEQADVWPDSLSRRKFMALMAASLALGGLSGCSLQPAPAEKIVPYVHPQQEITAGRPLFFATTMIGGGDVVGLLVESHDGRPTKIEGNPDHPASLGAASALHQASVLSLYDPDRLQTVVHEGQICGWNDADRALRDALRKQQTQQGAGLRLLSEPIHSPTLAAQKESLLKRYPQAKWHQYEPINNDSAWAGTRMAFGQPASVVYDFAEADIVLSLDADFLASGAGQLRYARDFMQRRTAGIEGKDSSAATMNRLYVVEPTWTCTGAKADHRLALSGRDTELLIRAIASELGVVQGSASNAIHPGWVRAVVKDLRSARGRNIVLAGRRQPPSAHALVHAINERLGNPGKTVKYIAPPPGGPVDCVSSLRELAEDMDRGEVETLIILGGNPVYNAPSDLDFASRLVEVPLRFHWTLHSDETSQLCQWRLPATHYLESWSDARSYDGTASIVQPLIRPLYQGRSLHGLLARLGEEKQTRGDEIVRGYWRRSLDIGPNDFEDWWQTALHDGVIAESAARPLEVALRDDWQEQLSPLDSSSSAGLELNFDADPTIFDGSYANNGWLQELPKPLTKLTWDNAVLLSPETASSLGVSERRFAHGGEHGGYQVPVVEVRVGEAKVTAPVWIVPGQAKDTATVHLGYGRRFAGRVGGNQEQSVGFDAYRLRTSDRLWFNDNVAIAPTGEFYSLACTQAHHSMDNRDIIRTGTLADYHRDPNRIGRGKTPHHESEPTRTTSLYESAELASSQQQWGMVINMTACTGCSACVVACQAENNIPVVGKEQVLFGREMHWLRIDRYLSGEADSPDSAHFQPLPCMHCEHAPCEYVCPVMATVHSADGLNDMVYNRCVGTRFCSNNCPYKVRRFNFLHYSDYETVSLRLQYNPDVTVRSRGVMEKCTYCVQRIRAADSDAAAAGRALQDGEILTACQASCPTQAIVFGNLNDLNSAVAKAKQSPLQYALLEELNTHPRTTYLAELRNPNPDLEDA